VLRRGKRGRVRHETDGTTYDAVRRGRWIACRHAARTVGAVQEELESKKGRNWEEESSWKSGEDEYVFIAGR
jgi:hypothetical protein